MLELTPSPDMELCCKKRLKKLAQTSNKENKALQVLAEITKLRRFCCHPKLVLKNASLQGCKLMVFADVVLELLENKHNALVFRQFVDHLSIVRTWLEQQGITYQ